MELNQHRPATPERVVEIGESLGFSEGVLRAMTGLDWTATEGVVFRHLSSLRRGTVRLSEVRPSNGPPWLEPVAKPADVEAFAKAAQSREDPQPEPQPKYTSTRPAPTDGESFAKAIT